MSSAYFLRCVQCSDDLDADSIGNPTRMRVLWRQRAELIAALEKLDAVCEAFEVEPGAGGFLDVETTVQPFGRSVRSLCDWLREHAEHQVVVRDEYGQEEPIEQTKVCSEE